MPALFQSPALESPSTTPVAQEVAVKPKIMRRPAQFLPSPAAPVVVALPIVENDKINNIKQNNNNIPLLWHEDGKFGVVLIATLVVVNLILALILSHTTTSAQPTLLTVQGSSGIYHTLTAKGVGE